jgi:hypothetical protein
MHPSSKVNIAGWITCQIPALLTTPTKHINMKAIISLEYNNDAPINKIMTTVKV